MDDRLRRLLLEHGEGLLAERLHQRLLDVLCIFLLDEDFRALEHLALSEKKTTRTSSASG